MSTTTKANEVVTLVTKNTFELIRTSTLRRLVAYPTHYLLVVNDGTEPETYILDATAFEASYAAEYGKSEDEATHRAFVAAALFRAVLEGGKTFHVLAKGAAAKLQEPTE